MTTTVISPYDGAMIMIALQRHSYLVHIEYLTSFTSVFDVTIMG